MRQRYTIIQHNLENGLPEGLGEFDACFCVPPYGLSFMGAKWDKEVPGPDMWKPIFDVLKPGANLFAFGGTKLWHRLAVALEDSGFEMNDTLMWLYGSGFPKSYDISKGIDKTLGFEREIVGPLKNPASAKKGTIECSFQSDKFETKATSSQAKTWEGYGTALKPAWEPVLWVAKPREGTYANNAMVHGVAGINVDGCRLSCDRITTTNGSQNQVYGDLSGIAGKDWESHSQGRWPANLILDETSKELLDASTKPTKSGKATKSLGQTKPGNMGGGLTTPSNQVGDSGGVSRFFYCTKATKKERMDSKHPTLKPIDLTKYFATLLLPPKKETPRRLLIPFSGAGSEIIGALNAGWDEVVGIEMNEEYIQDSHRRIKALTRINEGRLF